MICEFEVSRSYLCSKEAVGDIGGIFGAVEHRFLYFSKGCLKRFYVFFLIALVGENYVFLILWHFILFLILFFKCL